jgi:hypothetical protein
MRRSAYVVAPLLASAALALPGVLRASAQPPSPSTAQYEPQSVTERDGFGSSFREHPLVWIFGTAGVLYFFGSGS